MISSSFFLGRLFGINIRIHYFFLIFAYFRLMAFGDNWRSGALYLVVLWISVLLHEFGHALTAKWCDGEAEEIILWPLGGLAFCRPIFNAKAHFLTSAGGPLVSLILLAGAWVWIRLFGNFIPEDSLGEQILKYTYYANWMLFTFNMIPAFPMDGGRIVRDLLWMKFGVVKATRWAVGLTKLVCLASVPLVFLTQGYWFSENYFLLILALYMYTQSTLEMAALQYEGSEQPFSIFKRLRRKGESRPFSGMVPPEIVEMEAFHRCALCGKTEKDGKDIYFRVWKDGKEYCLEHLPFQ